MTKVSRRDLELERGWRGLLADQARSGLTVVAFCSLRGLSASSFHFWKRELARREQGEDFPSQQTKTKSLDAFVPVSVVEMGSDGIEIDIAGAIVRVGRVFDETALARVFHVLRKSQGEDGEARRC